ncbi:MAG TPA: hypothetical protein VGG15_05390 [Terriglobales bacterium]
MKVSVRASLRLTIAVATVLLLSAAIAISQDNPSGPYPSPAGQVGQGFTVQDFYGGQIVGYGVDQFGSEGVLSEYVEQSNGNLLIATETFNQATGRVLAVVERVTGTHDNFVTLGVVGTHIGLREWEHVQGLYVHNISFNTMNPLSGNRMNGNWLPPINSNTQFLDDVEGAQGNPNVVVMVQNKTCCGRSVFGSNVAANRFGPIITLQDPLFNGGVPPLLAYDSVTDQAVLAQAQGAPYSTPEIGLVDLSTRNVTEFTGLGDGFINGLAVDPSTGIACTTTETDNAAEFYNLATHTGFEVELPVIGRYSGAAVTVDPVNHLFLITHPVPFAPGQIHVYDENGHLIESLFNFRIGPAGAAIALNPGTRTGFIQAAGSNGNPAALQSFTY